ncbi:MAG TPA: aminoglycoside adenylyltransferase domain-containing protein [Acidimicrobiales bacterium]|nr:aminoglycoside adenylyltransferase domain-containing protein [Acidimicrobiales bacterium]
MSVSMDDLPAAAGEASRALVDELAQNLGTDLAAAWLHGGTTFPDRPVVPGDLDICIVVTRAAPDEREPAAWLHSPASRPGRAYSCVSSVAEAHGVIFDVNFLLVDDMGRGEPPAEAFDAQRRVTSWPVHRAHWLAGQYVPINGLRPEELVVAPTGAELLHALDRELEHIERHVHDGDAADPAEATYALWNGSRILSTLATGSPVISKRSAGTWATEHLPERWHAAIRAAGRTYDGAANDQDRELLRLQMGPFVEMVRQCLPVTQPRAPGPPRWS